jgi:hypothetical protein
MRRFAMLAVAGGMLLVPGQAAAARATGVVKKKCGTAFMGDTQPSEACAILWYDASTRTVSARCTVEYSFGDVLTNIFACELQQGRKKSFESVAETVPAGDQDTFQFGQTYTFETANVAAAKHQWSAVFDFQPSFGGTQTGPEVVLTTPWAL